MHNQQASVGGVMSETITFGRLAEELFRRWRQILVSMALGIILSIVLISRATPTYEASILVGSRKDFVNQNPTSGALSGILGSLSGSSNAGELARLELLLRSNWPADLASQSIDLSKLIFSHRWDDQSRSWKPRSRVNKFIWGLMGVKLGPAPTADETKSRLSAIMTIETQQQTYRAIRIRESNPQRAEYILQSIMSRADQTLRKEDAQEVDKLIEYTKLRLKEATIGRQLEVLSSTLLMLEQQRMNINASTIYSYQIIQPIRSETAPSAPRPGQYLAVGFMLPLLLITILSIVSIK
jgi:hypothetical protein